jgi:predicted transposase/invertase (TIGR01784 family)
LVDRGISFLIIQSNTITFFTKYLNPKNSVAFERIFTFDENEAILIRFLNDIFVRTTNPIEEATILKRPQDPKIACERTSFVDVSCKDTGGNHLIILMQVASAVEFLRRAPYYATKAYLEPRDKGTNYRGLKEVIFLAITDFILFPDNPDYLSHHATLDKETLKDFSFSFLELPKFKKNKEKLITLTEKWFFFLKDEQEMEPGDVPLVAGPDQIIAKAYDVVNIFNWKKEELAAYEEADMQRMTAINTLKTARLKGIEEGREEVRKEEIEEGRQEAKVFIAKNMLATGYKAEEIARITGLSKDQLDSL